MTDARPRRDIRTWAVLAVLALLVAGGIWAAVAIWPDADTRAVAKSQRQKASLDNLADQSADEIVAHLVSDKFDRLSQSHREQYYQDLLDARGRFGVMGDLMGGGRPDALDNRQFERLAAHSAMLMLKGMEPFVDEYFAQAPEYRQAWLIAQRARMEVERRTRRPRREGAQASSRATTQRHRRHGDRGFTPTMLKYVIEHTPPRRRAKFVEFVKDMRKRWSGRR